MPYSVDYADDYAHVDGVDTATYTPLSGSAVTTVKVRRAQLSFTDLQSGVLALDPGDVPWIVWLGTLGAAVLQTEATLTVNSVVYTIISWVERPDQKQARVFTRKRV
jgi:hypothetical protein